MKTFRYILILLLLIASATEIKSQTNEYFTHTVGKGQTLYSISRMYNTTVKELIEENPECAIKLSVGQKLKIKQKNNISEQTADNTNGARYHTIQPGETLYRLGQLYQITPQEICAANPGLSISNFRSGEVILIPVPAKRIVPVIKEEQKSIEENEETTIRTVHKVEKGETIYSITRRYGITEEELKAANPDLNLDKKKLKKNTQLKIPYSQIDLAAIENEKRIKEEQSNADIFRELEKKKDSIATLDTFQGIRVALILPFLLDSYAPNEQARMVEYYEGFLLAVEELKRYGYSFEINTFDSGQENASLETLINSGQLNNMDIIFGAVYPEHNKQLARFAKEKNIPLVIPFTSKEDEIFHNPMVYVVNTMQSYFFSEVTDHFLKAFPQANVIFVSDGANNKKEFINALTDKLNEKNVPHSTITLEQLNDQENNVATLSGLLKEDKENIFIPTSSKQTVLSSMLPTLILLNNDTIALPEYKLFGYPEWQIYAGNMDSRIYEVDTYFYASFFSHATLPETARFQNEFIRWYNRSLQNIYPRYGMLGHDTAYAFLLAISKYGTDMPLHINNLAFTPVQTGFKFERVNNWGGMVNKKIYFVHYTPQYNIEKIDFDKQ